MRNTWGPLVACCLLAGCIDFPSDEPADASAPLDARDLDSGPTRDSASTDAPAPPRDVEIAFDAGDDAAPLDIDGGSDDAGFFSDAGWDAGSSDAGMDAGRPSDAGRDAGPSDAGRDAGSDAGPRTCLCTNPPASPDFAMCAPGRSFTATLGGACHTHCSSSGSCAYDPFTVACPSGSTVLPQRYADQVILRNYLAGLTASDFAVSSTATISAPLATAPSDDTLYQLWLGVVNDPETSQPNLPSYAAARLPATTFLLSSIEAASPPRALIGRESDVSSATAWYPTWNYAGNPFYRSEGMLRRAFVIAAADMIWTQDCLDRHVCTDPDNIAGALREYGAVGYSAHRAPGIDACALAAYDAGLRRISDAWRAMTRTFSSPNADMTVAGISGLYYVAAALEDPTLFSQASAAAATILTNNCDPAGFCRHQNGTYDASYEGWTMQHLVEAAMVSNDPLMLTWVDRFARLRAHQIVLEPGDGITGPSHFSPATSLPAAWDQGDYHHYQRQVAVASISVEGRSFAFLHGGSLAFPTPAQMQTTIRDQIGRANDFASRVNHTPSGMVPWQERHYPASPEAGIRHYRPGTYAMLAALSGTDQAEPPLLRARDFSTAIDNDFFVARSSGLGLIVHAGDVDGAVDSGFGGGALSVVYTDATGPVLLGWNRGSQNDRPGAYGWADMYEWSTHALSGRRGSARFSSALIQSPTRSFPSSGGVTVSGNMSASSPGGDGPDPGNALLGDVTVSRTFTISGGVATVTTTLTPSGASSSADELYETFPIFLGEGRTPGATIEFRLSGSGGLVTAGTSNTASVAAIRVTRLSRAVEFAFDAPVTARLADRESTTTYQWNPVSRNVLVSRLASPGTITARSWTTTIRAL